jgi:glycosyltransferase involved in cell wall biosynthesis
MKILVPVHQFNNFGGIINHTEQLIAGLKDLGHEVTFAFLKPTAQKPKPVNIPTTLEDGWEIGAGTGLPVHQGKGWITPYYSFLNADSIAEFVKMANEHDVIIWESLFGFKNKNSEGNIDWLPMVNDVTPKQVVIIHDGNLQKLYPWIYKFKDKIAGVACVHVSAYASAAAMDLPRAMILNPQHIGNLSNSSFENRKRQILSPQTFKRWKHVDDLVASVPYLKDTKVIVAGDGIERNYMTSVDKCKPEYYCTKQTDPDATGERLGKRIWDNATDAGMDYVGFISETTRDDILSESMFLIDPSWSKTYGEHFNRTVVDAMKTGTVPLAVNLGIAPDENGVGTLFKPNENYLMLKYDYTPKEYGEKINEYMEINKYDYDRIVQNNFKLIKQFDRRKVAQDYLDLANGIDCGFYDSISKTGGSIQLPIDAEKMWTAHFEPEESASLESFFG